MTIRELIFKVACLLAAVFLIVRGHGFYGLLCCIGAFTSLKVCIMKDEKDEN